MGVINVRFVFLDGRDFVQPCMFDPREAPSAVLRQVGEHAEDFGNTILAAQDPKYAQVPRFRYNFLQFLGNAEVEPLPTVQQPFKDYRP